MFDCYYSIKITTLSRACAGIPPFETKISVIFSVIEK